MQLVTTFFVLLFLYFFAFFTIQGARGWLLRRSIAKKKAEKEQQKQEAPEPDLFHRRPGSRRRT